MNFCTTQKFTGFYFPDNNLAASYGLTDTPVIRLNRLSRRDIENINSNIRQVCKFYLH